MLLWFIIGVVFLVIEIFTFGLISIWFALGAFLTMIFYEASLENQFYIFVGASLLFLFLIRKLALKHFKGNSKELNRIKGKVVKIEKIEVRGSNNFYTVYLDGKIWEGISKFNFSVGDEAIVEKIMGNKLVLAKKY
ncbi:NfeD family protein [Candidatus Cetobacterium colombiensis]|uniref:NfeD family protein n=1 Tax=Candidatus Cetobacterium colombiensis TaxID=3073100 RepID=A0ABU4WFX7_9FUSO|nr:NfeD family protein [Candidatus Cetobacterium colombiensis]MDX8337461.1 NfeD family protein [Candidatus Cetobacterium colombiensis]